MAAGSIESTARERHDRLGRFKRFVRIELPFETVRIDAGHNPDQVVIADFDAFIMVAAVHQVEPVHIAMLLGCGPLCDHDAGIVAVAGSTCGGFVDIKPVFQRADMPVSPP